MGKSHSNLNLFQKKLVELHQSTSRLFKEEHGKPRNKCYPLKHVNIKELLLEVKFKNGREPSGSKTGLTNYQRGEGAFGDT